MFLPFCWVAGNERGEKSYVAAILCYAARANLDGVASCSTILSSDQGPPPWILHRTISSYPPPISSPSSLLRPFTLFRPLSCYPCQTHEPIDCRFCIICQDPNSLIHVPLCRHLVPLLFLFLYSLVTYRAVNGFVNNERNVSSTLFTIDKTVSHCIKIYIHENTIKLICYKRNKILLFKLDMWNYIKLLSNIYLLADFIKRL